MKSFLETWRDVAGYEGIYQVSDFGEVRSLNYNHTGQTRVMKPVKQTNGYLRVNLYKDGKKKLHRVHRLVAEAFIPNPYNLPEINHIDENKTNNVATNLEYCDRRYNNCYGTHYERSAKTQRNDPKKSEKVIQMTLDYIFVKEWQSTAECGRNGFCKQAVSLCCNNKYGLQGNVYKGCRWGYRKNYSIAKILSEYSCQSCL